ncbi:DUF2087 domain-containing protein [Paenibacillus sp. M1]|uniref:DUF2087 domain-containing protein n=1 Tax=Paenibacillus haidiansis TaxID=1574488 RepID=A0ABU7VTA5_9BACL
MNDLQKAQQPQPSRQQVIDRVVRNFLTPDGRLKHLPAKYKKKLIVLHHLAAGLQPDRTYTEQEINEYVKQFHEDYATIRREFIIHRLMQRENEVYKLNPPELWDRWDNLA